MTARMCDGHPNSECPSGCTDSCDFNNGTTRAAEVDRRANERIRRLEAGRAHLLTLADTPGNWWDKLKWYQRLGTVCAVILAVGLVVVS